MLSETLSVHSENVHKMEHYAENVLKPDKSIPVWSWLAFSLISGIGSKKIWDLIEHLGSVEDLLKTSPEILIEQF